jgi:NAD(P)-dependent dehydrogenase (short-subunit alcohol dehydrogenase family)
VPVLVSTDLSGCRVLVVGASSGVGRATGLAAALAGARVAFAARRAESLAEAVAAAGEGCVALTCDVRRPEDCEHVVRQAVDKLGGLDGVVYAPGVSALARFSDADAELWQEVVATNLIGAALVARAAIEHLETSEGKLVLLGSSSVGRPYPGLVPYAATKAGLHELARGLRAEYPWLRVTTFIVGPSITGFADNWDPNVATEMFERWVAEGYPCTLASSPEESAAEIVHVLAGTAFVTETAVMPLTPIPEGMESFRP